VCVCVCVLRKGERSRAGARESLKRRGDGRFGVGGWRERKCALACLFLHKYAIYLCVHKGICLCMNVCCVYVCEIETEREKEREGRRERERERGWGRERERERECVACANKSVLGKTNNSFFPACVCVCVYECVVYVCVCV